MKTIFKLLFILFLCFTTTFCTTLPTKTTITSPKPAYDFNFYTNHLIKGLFPQIRETVKPYNRFLSQEEAQEAVDKVFMTVSSYLTKNKIVVFEKPKVQIFKLSNDVNVVFILKVEIHFLDKAESKEDLLNTIIIAKKFLLFYGKEKKGEGI